MLAQYVAYRRAFTALPQLGHRLGFPLVFDGLRRLYKPSDVRVESRSPGAATHLNKIPVWTRGTRGSKAEVEGAKEAKWDASVVDQHITDAGCPRDKFGQNFYGHSTNNDAAAFVTLAHAMVGLEYDATTKPDKIDPRDPAVMDVGKVRAAMRALPSPAWGFHLMHSGSFPKDRPHEVLTGTDRLLYDAAVQAGYAVTLVRALFQYEDYEGSYWVFEDEDVQAMAAGKANDARAFLPQDIFFLATGPATYHVLTSEKRSYYRDPPLGQTLTRDRDDPSMAFEEGENRCDVLVSLAICQRA